MDKITYLAELAEGLARWVPERERQDILRYYAEYFEEAGPGREAEVMAELGDPWALSCRLAVEGGYVTYEKAASWTPRKTWPRVLLGTAVGLSIFALVAGIGRLAFNVMRVVTSDDPMRYAGVAIIEAEPTAIVDWGQESFDNVTFVAEGTALIDGGSVASFESIDVDIALGNIKVVAGDDFTVSVTRSEALSGYEPWWEVRDGVLKLRAGGGSQMTESNIWNDLKSMFDGGQWAVDVTITVPEGAALDNINVEAGLGDVLLYGVNAHSITVETGMGDVECYNPWNTRKLDLSTGLGNVNLGMEQAPAGLNISLKSGKGNVEASLCGMEEDYSYELESSLGAVTVDGSYRGGKAERSSDSLMNYKLSAASGAGDVNVCFSFDWIG